jgi:glycosyltransferase involved in cell wall biosynthesis
MTKPLVSVLISTYNRKDLLCEAIDSALSQNVPEMEVIVADDGSTDGTAEELHRRYPDESILRYVPLPHRGLPAATRNAALMQARGRYVAFLDSDDLWCVDKLALQVAALEKHPDIGWSFGRARFLYEDGRRGPSTHAPWLYRSGWVLKRLLKGNFVPASSVVVRKELLDTLGPFDEDPSLRAAEDYELWLRLSHRSRALALPQVLILYRLHTTNASSTTNDQPTWAALESASKKLVLAPRQRGCALSMFYFKRFQNRLAHAPNDAIQALRASAYHDRANWRAQATLLLWKVGGNAILRGSMELENLLRRNIGLGRL